MTFFFHKINSFGLIHSDQHAYGKKHSKNRTLRKIKRNGSRLFINFCHTKHTPTHTNTQITLGSKQKTQFLFAHTQKRRNSKKKPPSLLAELIAYLKTSGLETTFQRFILVNGKTATTHTNRLFRHLSLWVHYVYYL